MNESELTIRDGIIDVCAKSIIVGILIGIPPCMPSVDYFSLLYCVLSVIPQGNTSEIP